MTMGGEGISYPEHCWKCLAVGLKTQLQGGLPSVVIPMPLLSEVKETTSASRHIHLR